MGTVVLGLGWKPDAYFKYCLSGTINLFKFNFLNLIFKKNRINVPLPPII